MALNVFIFFYFYLGGFFWVFFWVFSGFFIFSGDLFSGGVFFLGNFKEHNSAWVSKEEVP